MKKDIHPNSYRQVIFEDSTSGKRFLRLAILGRSIVEAETGKPLLLRGVNISGNANVSGSGVTYIIKGGGFTVTEDEFVGGHDRIIASSFASGLCTYFLNVGTKNQSCLSSIFIGGV